jgi:hypothetical protein
MGFSLEEKDWMKLEAINILIIKKVPLEKRKKLNKKDNTLMCFIFMKALLLIYIYYWNRPS